MSTARAVLEAQAEVDAVEAEDRRLDPHGRKARWELAEAKLLAAEEARIEERQLHEHNLAAGNRRQVEAKARAAETLAAFVEAREELAVAEHELTQLNARARKLGIPVPDYVWMARDVANDTALRHLVERARAAIRNGIF